ncbi:MaoC family dehydratase [Salinarchaeum sp. IM2453]|uniref:MaoC family dehydratase n=1 Tax=Salinarchaeum sp. IM2453 TaxID=2862870 RepID=UPI001C82B0E5|nr:MaoC family dehydratase [Salinarchaeum sp. IM2453]QZA88289.1 MaoC family dehydratase [Salinarchaeum sp. IM2453]
MPGKYFEEFEIGEIIKHNKRRTITESDNHRFCDLTMNQQPLHIDHAFANETQFEEPLVNGLYTMSLAVGISVPDTTEGTAVANLSYNNVEHPEPVFHGDTIRVQSTVTDKRETSDGTQGIVTMHVEAFKVNTDEETLVCEFDRTALCHKKSGTNE